MTVRAAFVADVHIGNHRRFGGPSAAGINTRCRDVLHALADAVREAERLEADVFVVLGDLFDTAKPTPQELAAVMKIFEESGLEIDVLLGNHDQSSATPGDNALAPLGFLHDVRVHEVPTVRAGLILVPFQPGPANEWLPRALDALAPPPGGTLCLHLGIADAKTAPFLRGSPDSITVDELQELCARWKIKAVFAGNWHDHRTWSFPDLTIHQVGALVPTGFDNPGERYGFLASTFQHTVQVSERPRFLIRSFEDDGLEDLTDRAQRPYVKVTARVSHLSAARAELHDLRSNGVISDFFLVPDREVVAAAAHSAAKAARSAATVDEAITRYIEKMPVEEGVARAAVLAHVQKYLG